jgi:hypothetical protein
MQDSVAIGSSDFLRVARQLSFLETGLLKAAGLMSFVPDKISKYCKQWMKETQIQS